MTLPLISAAVAAFLIILQMVLMLTVGMYRANKLVPVGVGTDQKLERLARRHGNLAENAGLFLATLAIAELVGISSTIITGFGVAFVVARILHVIGFSSLVGSHMADGAKVFIAARAIGAFGTALSGIGLGGYLAYVLLTAS